MNKFSRGRRQIRIADQFRSFFVLPAILTLWLFPGLTQLQIAVFDQVYVYSVHLKIALLVSTIFIWGTTQALQTRQVLHGVPTLRTAYAVWLAYVIVGTALVLFRFSYPISYVFFSLNVMFYFPLFLGFLVAKPGGRGPSGKGNDKYVNSRTLLLLTILAVPVIGLGIAQHLTNSPILPVSVDHVEYMRVIHTDFIGGGTRAFGIFSSGWAFGDYSIFMLLLWSAVAMQKSTPRYQSAGLWLLTGLAAIGVYCTLTRAVYLEFLLAVLGTWLLGRRNVGSSLYTRLSICLAASLGVGILLWFEYLGTETGYITSTASIYSRIHHWQNVFHQLGDGNVIANWAFGKGLIANERYELARGFNTDNVYLAIILYCGIFGLVAFAVLFWRILQLTFAVARRSDDPFWKALAAFLFAVPTVGVWNVQLNTPALLLILVWLISPPMQFVGKRDD